jgi:predicted metal-dependent hydrolase
MPESGMPKRAALKAAAEVWYDSEAYWRGLDLLNRGRYFDAHEVLEDVWRKTRGHERQFLQGLTQVAVALHHRSTGNLEGARSVMQRAGRNLSPYSNSFGGIDVDGLRETIALWRQALREAQPLPNLKIALRQK